MRKGRGQGGWGSIYRRGARRAGYRALAWARCMAVHAEAVWEGSVVYLDRVRGSGAGGDRGRAGWNVGWERTVGIRARSTQRGFVFVVSRRVDGVGIWPRVYGLLFMGLLDGLTRLWSETSWVGLKCVGLPINYKRKGHEGPPNSSSSRVPFLFPPDKQSNTLL